MFFLKNATFWRKLQPSSGESELQIAQTYKRDIWRLTRTTQSCTRGPLLSPSLIVPKTFHTQATNDVK